MIKLDIISGFLGAGKTTLIKKLLENSTNQEKVVIIENEFGEMGIDGSLLEQTGASVRELYSGCICCTLSGDFKKTITEMIHKFSPDRIIIEPSGVGKLSEVLKACEGIVKKENIQINMLITVVDVLKFQMYLTNFGEFFEDQIKNAKTIFLSRTEKISSEALEKVTAEISKLNEEASIVTTPWDQLTAEKICSIAEGKREALLENLASEMNLSEAPSHEEGMKKNLSARGCQKGGKLRHYRKQEKHCGCSHGSHHDHSADEIFEAWGVETPLTFSHTELEKILTALEDKERFGLILRGKGIVQLEATQWAQFDYTLGEIQISTAAPEYTGRICIIGSQINRNALEEVFLGAK